MSGRSGRAGWRRMMARGSGARRLIGGASATTGMKLVSMGLRFAATICLTRLLGVENYGVYAFVFTLMTVLGEPVFGGLRTLMLRNTAQLKARDDWPGLAGLRQSMGRITLGATLGVGLLLPLIGLAMEGGARGPTFVACVAAAPLPILLGLMRHSEGALIGQGHVIAGQIPKLLLRPLLTLAVLGGWLWAAAPLNAAGALWLLGATALLGLIAYRVADRRYRPPQLQGVAPRHDTRRWLSGGLPLMISAGFYIVEHQGAVLVIGALADARTTGLFHAAMRLAELTGLVYASANIVLQPRVARLHARGEMRRLQRLIGLSTLAMCGVTAAIAAGIWLWGDILLRLFGTEFTEAHGALAVMAGGVVLSVALGPSTMILPMTDRAGDAARGVILGAIVNVGLSAALVPHYGLMGAAAAQPAAVLTAKSYLAWRVRRGTGIDPTLLGGLRLLH